MTETELWARIVGTVLQMIGLGCAAIGLLNTRREFSNYDPGALQRRIAQALERLSNTIRRAETPAAPVFGPSQIGWATVTLRDPLAPTLDLDPTLSAAQQIRQMHIWVQENRTAVLDFEAQRQRLDEGLATTSDDLRKLAEEAKSDVRKLALGGLRLAAIGLFATFAGAVITAFS